MCLSAACCVVGGTELYRFGVGKVCLRDEGNDDEGEYDEVLLLGCDDDGNDWGSERRLLGSMGNGYSKGRKRCLSARVIRSWWENALVSKITVHPVARGRSSRWSVRGMSRRQHGALQDEDRRRGQKVWGYTHLFYTHLSHRLNKWVTPAVW